MRRILVFLLTFSFQLALAETTVVTALDKSEPYEGMSFHDGVLWVGKSRKAFNSDYSLEAYQANKLLGSVSFTHSASFVYPYAKNSVIVVGTGYQPRLTQYTIVVNNNGKLSSSTRVIPLGGWAREWLGTLNGKEYFTDPGGNPNDSQMNGVSGLAAQTFFTVDRFSPARYLPVRLRLPLAGLKVGSQFYVINAESIGSPQGNLFRLDPKANKVSPVFPNHRHDLMGIAHLASKNLLAVTEEGAEQLLLVDSNSEKLLSTFAVPGAPRSVSFLGKCALVGSRESRQVTAVDVSDPGSPSKVATLSVDLPLAEFQRVDKVVSDPVSGKIYARSNYPCNFMTQQCDEEWNKVVAFEGEMAQAVASNCLSR